MQGDLPSSAVVISVFSLTGESDGPTKGKQNEGSSLPTLTRWSSALCSSRSTASCGTEPIETAGRMSVVPCSDGKSDADVVGSTGVKNGVAVIMGLWSRNGWAGRLG